MAAHGRKKRNGPMKRERALGVHSLDRFGYEVPNLAVAEAFHRAFGLDVGEEGGALAIRTTHGPHRWGTIMEGPRKRLHHLSFGLFEEDLPGFARRLQRLGVARIDPPKGLESNGIWLRDHDGTAIEVKVADKVSPAAKKYPRAAHAEPGYGASPKRSLSGRTHPQRLSHVLLFTASVDKAIEFYTRVLGLRVSDRSASDIVFLHAPHGSDHHVIAFLRSGGPGFHHSSWAVNSVHEIGIGAERMAEQGHAAGWGVGRHVLGSNYFYYVRDPWGSYCEYSYDIDFIPADVDWRSGDYGPEDSFYVWGPKPPADFGTNFELA